MCTVQEGERELFASGELWQQWVREYPNIFDEDDRRLARSQAKLGIHFYEWQAAVLLYQTMGYHSLVGK